MKDWIRIENCPFCGIKNTYINYSVATRVDFTRELAGTAAPAGYSIQYVMCLRCGLIYQNPRMADDSLKYFYSSGEYRKFVTAHAGSNDSFDEKEAEDAVRLVKSLPGSLKVTHHLDIGASRGFLLKETALLYQCKTAAVEPNLNWLFYHPNAEFEDVDSVTGDFDLITLIHVLEHLSEPLKMIKKIRDLLSVDGTAIIEVPYGPDAARLPHLFIFSSFVLWRMLEGAGLVVTKLDVNPHFRFYVQRRKDA